MGRTATTTRPRPWRSSAARRTTPTPSPPCSFAMRPVPNSSCGPPIRPASGGRASCRTPQRPHRTTTPPIRRSRRAIRPSRPPRETTSTFPSNTIFPRRASCSLGYSTRSSGTTSSASSKEDPTLAPTRPSAACSSATPRSATVPAPTRAGPRRRIISNSPGCLACSAGWASTPTSPWSTPASKNTTRPRRRPDTPNSAFSRGPRV